MLDIIAAYIVPVVSVTISYFFGRIQSTQSDKKAAYKEAYETFYLPFIHLLYDARIWNTSFSSIDKLQRKAFFDLITSNIRYMNDDILDILDCFYSHYDVITDTSPGESFFIITPARLDEVFDELTERVLSRASWLSQKLYQPQLAEYVLSLYRAEMKHRKKSPEELPQR